MQSRDLETPRTHISEALLDAVAANVSEAKLDSWPFALKVSIFLAFIIVVLLPQLESEQMLD